MDDIASNSTIIRSKLHRPAIVGNHVDRGHLLERLQQRIQRPLTLIAAPAGYGKSMLASYWLEASSCPSAWVSLDRDDNDLRLFLNYFLSAIHSMFPDACRQAMALATAMTLPPVSTLAGTLINEFDLIEEAFILVLDDFHLINDESVLDILTRLLRHPPKGMHLTLIGRRDPPLPISKLRAKKDVTEIRAQDLRFGKTETARFLTLELGIPVESDTAAALEEKTEGWVTGLRLAALSMRHRGKLDPGLLGSQVNAQYVMEYLFNEVFSQQPPEINNYLLGTAILDRFTGSLCETVCSLGDDSRKGTIGGWHFIDWLKKENLFVIPLDAENRWFRFHHIFKKLLANQLNRRLSPDEINALHARASAWFDENGLIEEAIKHAMSGGNSKAAVQLIAKHGFRLLNDVQWPRLQRWLKMLPEEIIAQEAELLVLVSWFHQIYSRPTELVSCLNKAEALCANLTDKQYLVGHINALRLFHHYLTINGESSLTCARRALKKLPPKHRWARMFTFLAKAAVHQMLGDREQAIVTFEEAMRESDLNSDISESHYQANPCFIYWMEADMSGMVQTARRALRTGKNCQELHAISQGLYFMGIAHYLRDELQAAEEKLASVVNEPYAQYAHNFAHTAFALALVYQAQGRMDMANQVGDSVVSFGLDTNHSGVLKIARAFQAELALRQGRIAEASHWAAQFVPKPFTPMYRFYVPRLTLVKVLLAQDTMDSKEQAAELLDQLYSFVISTHNKRFQIDVQALQALLYDSRGEGPAALKRLTHALQLAEPGSFIRPFVDLGPLMADLLKKQHKQRSAANFIEKILAAFEREGVQKIVPEATERPAVSTRQPQRPSPPSTSLVEPLTNRELDVLNLLAQRLSNKEIADRLFISLTTVKGHLQNIYGKLGTKKRREAVEKARQIGIL